MKEANCAVAVYHFHIHDHAVEHHQWLCRLCAHFLYFPQLQLLCTFRIIKIIPKIIKAIWSLLTYS